MGGINSNYNGPKEVHYLFIDGGCLRACLKGIIRDFADGKDLELDYERIGAGYSKIFYYDALPAKLHGEEGEAYGNRIAPEKAMLDKLSVLRGFHVYEGDTRRSNARRGQEQKKIDVMIAIDMLMHTFKRNMHEATLLTSDLDFKPLIDALVQEGMFVNLWYPPADTTKELYASADARKLLTVNSISQFLTVETKANLALPSQSFGEKEEAPEGLILRWTDARIGELLLKTSNDKYHFVYTNSNIELTGVYTHHNLEALKRYVSEVFKISIPKTS